MKLTDLTDEETLALIVLAKALAHSDGVVTNTEMVDLVSLGEVIGMERFDAALQAAEPWLRDWDTVFSMADRVERYDARELIYALLEELAKGDGMEATEKNVLNELQRRWSY